MAGSVFYYGGIVKNGLVILLDSFRTISYPKTGNIWYDISKNNINSNLYNSPTLVDTGRIFGISLDGINDYVGTNYTTNDTYYTFELIIKPNSVSGTQVYIGKYNGALSSVNFWMGLNGGSFLFSINGTTINSSITASTSQYYVITCSNAPDGKKIYINGVLKNTGSSQATTPNGEIAIGRFGVVASNYSSISVYGFKYYNRHLTDSEVLINYNTIKSRFGLS
jgi:hypothetical protein